MRQIVQVCDMLFHQIVGAVALLLFLGISGADCLVPNARMSDAEKISCQQMVSVI